MAVSTSKLALGLRIIFFLHKLYNPKVKASNIEIHGNDPKEINKYNRDAPTHKHAIVCTLVNFSFRNTTAKIIVTIGFK